MKIEDARDKISNQIKQKENRMLGMPEIKESRETGES